MEKHRPLALFLIVVVARCCFAQTTKPFDGRAWNISTGNISVGFIKASPIGAKPQRDVMEEPPGVKSLVMQKDMGLVANEDYLAWGGRWSGSRGNGIFASMMQWNARCTRRE